jgi:putative chitinase
MHVITADQLRKAVPYCSQPAAWVDPLNNAMLLYGISYDVDYMVEFLAQSAHETQGFNRLEENLSYTAERLVEVWPSRFPSITVAAQYARAPHKLADFVYGGRMGNTAPGDGWKYRGRGIPHVTGKDNYVKVSKLLNDPSILTCPDKLCTKTTAALAGAAFWASNPKLNTLADDTPTDDDYADFVSITKIVNGGKVGLAERWKLREAFKASLSTK